MRLRFICGLLAVLAYTLPLTAQSSGGDGYLFSPPHATFSLRGGYARASASSDVFSFVTERLTVAPGDFSGLSLAGDLAFRLHSRADLLLGSGIATRVIRSEDRGFIGTDDLPIEQRTTFRRIPITAGVKLHLRPEGRTVSRLAWVPSTVSPYVAAGGGMMYYLFKQDGEFVDYKTFDIFRTSLKSSDVSAMAFGAVGTTYSLSPHVGLNAEVRYEQARGALSSDFRGFSPIDLSGVGFTAGFLFRF
jgi:opacity protein-like surface antigen